MKLWFSIAICLVCFAANSLLTRVALLQEHIDPASFTAIRVLAGAVVLLPFFLANKKKAITNIKYNLTGAAALGIYALLFSIAYISLNTGLGALILFATVQIAMFFGAFLLGKKFGTKDYIGISVCLLGLGFLFWPSGTDLENISYGYAAMMVASGIAWGIYTLLGTRSRNPIFDNAFNFLLLTPIALIFMIFTSAPASLSGIVLAVVSGAITSGLAYSLWYSISPKINIASLSIMQTTVPIIATFMGIVTLDETVDLKFIVALIAIILGIVIQNYKDSR